MILASVIHVPPQSYVFGAQSCKELAGLGLFVNMVDPSSHDPQLRYTFYVCGAPIWVLGPGVSWVFWTLDGHTVLLHFLLVELLNPNALTQEPRISYYYP